MCHLKGHRRVFIAVAILRGPLTVLSFLLLLAYPAHCQPASSTAITIEMSIVTSDGQKFSREYAVPGWNGEVRFYQRSSDDLGYSPAPPAPQPPAPQTGWSQLESLNGIRIYRDNTTGLEWTYTLGTVPSSDRGHEAAAIVARLGFRLPSFDELRTITQHRGHQYLGIRAHLFAAYETSDPNVLGKPWIDGFQTPQARVGTGYNYVIGVR